MRIFLTTAMILGAVFMFKANSSAEAMSIQTAMDGTHQTFITPAHFHGRWGFEAPYWGNPYWGDPYGPYYYDYGPVSPGVSLFFSF